METRHYGLPLLDAGQAQKEISHNEALTIIDFLLGGLIEGMQATPPASAEEGTGWIVGVSAAGVWAGREGQIALFAGGWRFIRPRPGLILRQRQELSCWRFDGTSWKGATQITSPSGGSVIDVEARVKLGEILILLRNYGLAAT